MSEPVIVGAARTAIGTARKGTLANTTGEELAEAILTETVRRSGLDPRRFDDVIFAESLYGGGDLARHAAVATGMLEVPGVALNRHCAGSLASIGMAAAQVKSGMDSAVIAGGVQASSLSPKLSRRVPGTAGEFADWIPLTHPDRADAPALDMSISVGWNTAKAAGISRGEMDAWAYRSHMRAVAAIDAGTFTDEIVPLKVTAPDGSVTDFATDEHPRRDTTMEKLAALKVLHPEIPGFSITAGNSSGINDAAAAVAITSADLAAAEGLEPLASILAWAAAGVDPALMGFGALRAAEKVLQRAGRTLADIALWEINEAFASVPIAACREFGLDEELVNVSGSGCSLGHPISASGARMVTSLVYELRRRGGGLGLATMCAGGGQGGAVLIEVRPA
jgi:acetyl-CoA acetyltransferase family protein